MRTTGITNKVKMLDTAERITEILVVDANINNLRITTATMLLI